MDGTLNPVLACPCHHVAGSGAVFDASQSDFTQHADTGCSEFLEVVFHHPMLNDRCPGMNPHSTWTECGKRALRENCHCLQANDVLRTTRSMHLAGGNHGSD